ncbi:fimbrial chaperone protein [Salmonella enterica subsp. enterica serovar Richmond]|uniref:fimbrial chaperone n=1 Tax=Salmonella enterica TaxID=28901 RepID=UPI000E032D0B|nr:fimbrial chaperone protein [Salmonella enterica subsp. enterica serovar Richmond]EAA2047854.1 fimbrial chaperone protein [Salmonella enterica subsp. enterica serovar Chester]EAB8017783.1 fimbrial chaperone [Salmonella enterica subsp. enterica serovar Newport]EAC1168462.1 fimbrial chaperone [Salmonella enterica subsp. enterica serovar Typhimurium]EAP0132942.1 fimbrial chaperone protein [Salmonella enterica]EBH3089500.1 fimbrial chaperone [Salmonella enterica subsp. enterica serovar Poona]EB
MSKIIFKSIVLIIGILTGSQAIAAFTLNGTRFIYDEGRKNISVEVTNVTNNTYGGQVWVDNTTTPSSEVYFTPAPSFFKISGKEKQVVRLLNINSNLPTDRESLFWLNVQEIPPASKEEGNVLALALNTQVKLFYRPKAIKDEREKAEQQLVRDGTKLKNPTPYYFAITSVSINGIKITPSNSLDKKLSQMAPFSEIDIGQTLSGTVVIEAIDDYGARREYKLK